MFIKLFSRIVLLLVVLCASLNAADSGIGVQVSSVAQQLSTLSKALAVNYAKMKASDKKKADLDWADSALNRKKEQLMRDLADLNVRAAPLLEAKRHHDDNPPDPNCDSCVAAYNREAKEGDDRMAPFIREAGDLDKTTALLAEIQKTNSEETMKWFAERKAITADTNEKMADYTRLYNRLQNLKKEYSQCRDEVIKNPRVSDETVKHQCGNIQFDGSDRTLHELEIILPPSRLMPN
jgi:hypothetical protein